MRKTLTALAVLLFFAVPIAGHASPFQYTMTLDFPIYNNLDLTYLNGTYTFTVPSYLDHAGVVPVGFSGFHSPGYTYIEAPDLTWPASAGPSIEILFDLVPTVYHGFPNLLGVNIVTTNSLLGGYIASYSDDPNDIYRWVGRYYDQNDNLQTESTLDITDLGNSSPVPEPSSILMLGTGVLGIAAQMRRNLSRTKSSGKSLAS